MITVLSVTIPDSSSQTRAASDSPATGLIAVVYNNASSLTETDVAQAIQGDPNMQVQQIQGNLDASIYLNGNIQTETVVQTV